MAVTGDETESGTASVRTSLPRRSPDPARVFNRTRRNRTEPVELNPRCPRPTAAKALLLAWKKCSEMEELACLRSRFGRVELFTAREG